MVQEGEIISKESEQIIREKEAFIALVTKAFIEQEDRYKECQLADELNKAMYAIIMEKGINWDHFKQFKWRKIYYKAEPSIIKDIENDLAIIKYIRSIGDKNAKQDDPRPFPI